MQCDSTPVVVSGDLYTTRASSLQMFLLQVWPPSILVPFLSWQASTSWSLRGLSWWWWASSAAAEPWRSRRACWDWWALSVWATVPRRLLALPALFFFRAVLPLSASHLCGRSGCWDLGALQQGKGTQPTHTHTHSCTHLCCCGSTVVNSSIITVVQVVEDVTEFYKQTYDNYKTTKQEALKETLRLIHFGVRPHHQTPKSFLTSAIMWPQGSECHFPSCRCHSRDWSGQSEQSWRRYLTETSVRAYRHSSTDDKAATHEE